MTTQDPTRARIIPVKANGGLTAGLAVNGVVVLGTHYVERGAVGNGNMVAVFDSQYYMFVNWADFDTLCEIHGLQKVYRGN